MKLHLSALFLSAFSLSVFAAKPNLTVYTYDSFAADWGAAPLLKKDFEAQCGCEVTFVPFDDGLTMLNRLRLEGKKSKADVVLGLDNFSREQALSSELFTAHQLPLNHVDFHDPIFFPFDQGAFAFIYRQDKLSSPPHSLKELVERQDLKIIYQDPRTSVVGQGLLLWLNEVYGAKSAQAWQQLATHTVSIGKGWSETYGAFLQGEADLVLSYTSSPLYHLWNEADSNYAAANFSEGHIRQIELAAITKQSNQFQLAQQFLQFLHTPKSQEIIAKHNVMQPVVKLTENTDFQSLEEFKHLNVAMPNALKLKQMLKIWQENVSK